MRFAALLRGVNAGGKRRVQKSEFLSVLEGLGFSDVTVYINSGNAVFSSSKTPVALAVQSALEERFGFEVPTLVLSGAKVQSIAHAIPPEWTNDPLRPEKSGQKSDVMYLFDEINSPDVLEKLGYKPEVETMLYTDGAVLSHVARANQSRSSLKAVIGTPLYQQMTVRNVNTARKLADLVRCAD